MQTVVANEKQNIRRLMDEVMERLASPENQRKVGPWVYPGFCMGVEDPIAFCKWMRYDFRRCLIDPEFSLAQQLRNKLFEIEHLDGTLPRNPAIPAWPGGYAEYSLFGIGIDFTSEGVPLLQDDHRIAASPDLSLVPGFDFKTSGQMPRILDYYNRQMELMGDGGVELALPTFLRGGLDIAIQLRGYENWIVDTIERPQFVHDLMQLIVDYRIAYTESLHEYLGKPAPETVGLADDWINIPFITPVMFEDFVLPYCQQIAEHYGGVTNVHTCGCQNGIVKQMASVSGLERFEFSGWTSVDLVVEQVPEDMPLIYSLKPNEHVLQASVQEIGDHLRLSLRKLRGRKVVIQAGGLQPIHEDYGQDIRRLHEFADAAWEALAEFGSDRQALQSGGQVV